MGTDWQQLYQGTICPRTSRFVFNHMLRRLCRACKDDFDYRYPYKYLHGISLCTFIRTNDVKNWNTFKKHIKCTLNFRRNTNEKNKRQRKNDKDWCCNRHCRCNWWDYFYHLHEKKNKKER